MAVTIAAEYMTTGADLIDPAASKELRYGEPAMTFRV